MRPLRAITIERFWEKVAVGEPDACWPWLASVKASGYGQFNADGKNVTAHRLAWKLLVGPIADGLVLDHRCHNQRCCNPAHLRAITQKQNSEHVLGPTIRSTSGFLGVSRRGDRWRATVTHEEQCIHLGVYNTRAEAAAAARAARLVLFTHNDNDRKDIPA